MGKRKKEIGEKSNPIQSWHVIRDIHDPPIILVNVMFSLRVFLDGTRGLNEK